MRVKKKKLQKGSNGDPEKKKKPMSFNEWKIVERERISDHVKSHSSSRDSFSREKPSDLVSKNRSEIDNMGGYEKAVEELFQSGLKGEGSLRDRYDNYLKDQGYSKGNKASTKGSKLKLSRKATS